jgi:glycosyltransferase involved in cell wall biosynthesis
MRAALLTWDFPPVPTGLGRAAAEIAYGLVSQGADVTVFTLDRTGRETAENGRLTIIGAGFEDDPALTSLRKRAMLGHLAAPRACARALTQEESVRPFDIVETTNWYAPGALYRGSAPLIVRNSTPAIDAFDRSASLRDRTDLRFAHWLEAHTARRAAALISNAPHHRTKIESWYDLQHPDHSVIPLSLEPEKIERGRQAPPPKREGSFRFVFVGRAERRKGFDDMLTAFADLAQTDDVQLTTIGLAKGDLAKRAQALGIDPSCLSRIADLGRADEPELLDALEGCDAVLAPSRYESYGIVYREAAAFGRPLIACAEDPSARDLITTHGIGVLASACSAEAIAEAARRVMTDDRAAEEMRRRGLQLAERLHRETLGAETLEVYERAMGRTAFARAA